MTADDVELRIVGGRSWRVVSCRRTENYQPDVRAAPLQSDFVPSQHSGEFIHGPTSSCSSAHRCSISRFFLRRM